MEGHVAEIAELEQRIKDAMDRIGAGLDGLNAAGGGSEALQEALETEKMANAQLEERIRSLRDTHDAQLQEVKAGMADRMASLEAQVEQMTTDLNDAKSQTRALRQSNQRLQASLQSLREAGSGEVEPHLINHAMMSELEALRASRQSDQAELDEILGALKPMLGEQNNA